MDRVSTQPAEDKFQVATFYCFTSLTEENIVFLLNHLERNSEQNKLMGTILIASEGVNGTICGSPRSVASMIDILHDSLLGNHLELKFSWTSKQAFRRFKVRKKLEIVTMGIEGVNPKADVGIYVEPEDWNSYLNDPETIVIDTRNEYEIGIGTFNGSINPHTNCFREFPSWVNEFLIPFVGEKKPKRIAMFCTGGIRCEKATSYLRKNGFKDVYHLHGGILRYLEEVPEQKSLWKGECFVFDQRVALNHNLLPGDHRLCHACGMPLDSEDRKLSSYIRGVQCHYCENIFTDVDRSRFSERQRQYDNQEQISLRNQSSYKL